MKSTDLNVAVPEDLPNVLRFAADLFEQSSVDLPAVWGDKNAGKIWHKFALILERAARSCETALDKELL